MTAPPKKAKWYHLTPTSIVLLVCSAAFSFCCFWDPGSLRISFLGIPLFVYGIELGAAALLILFGQASWKWIGFMLGGIAFSTFWLGILPHSSISTKREVEGTVASLALYGTIAAFYWLQMWRRLQLLDRVVEPLPPVITEEKI